MAIENAQAYRLLEELDRERLEIAQALGLTVKTIFEHFHLSFHVPVASISEMNQQMHAQGNGDTLSESQGRVVRHNPWVRTSGGQQ